VDSVPSVLRTNSIVAAFAGIASALVPGDRKSDWPMSKAWTLREIREVVPVSGSSIDFVHELNVAVNAASPTRAASVK